MKTALALLFLVFSPQSNALECKNVLSSDGNKVMNFKKVASALTSNYGISLIEKDPGEDSVKGFWRISDKTIMARHSPILPQEVILAHELSHVATDLKIEKEPSLQNLARGIVFHSLSDQQSLNQHLRQSSLPLGYQNSFALDEAHARIKQIRVSEALARRSKSRGHSDFHRFLIDNPRQRGLLRQFLASSKSLLKMSLIHLDSSTKDLEVYYEQKPRILNKTPSSRNGEESVLENLFYVQVLVPDLDNTFPIGIQFTINWEGDQQEIPSQSIGLLKKITREAVAENAQLIEFAEKMRLLSPRDLTTLD